MSGLYWRGSTKPGAIELPGQDLARRLARERFLVREQLIGGDAIGEDIDAMGDRLAQQLLGRHVGGRARVLLRRLPRLLGNRLGEVEIHQAHAGVAGDQDILGLEIQVHEAVLVHVFEALGHVNENLRDVFQQHRVVLRVKLLEVRGLDVIHQQVELSLDLAVLDVADDAVVVADLGEDFGPAHKAPPGQQVEAEPFVHAAQGVGLLPLVGGQPDVGHAAAVEEFLQIESAKRPRRGCLVGARLLRSAKH